jgi:uncharacterized membrane protein (UPF0127 family)
MAAVSIALPPRSLIGRLAVLAAALLCLLPMAACDDKASASVEPVTINGRTFFLEVAADEAVRMKGLGQRTSIDADGGMIFVFDRKAVRSFVMRDCPIPIDIIYLDASGRVLAWHQMKAEKPRGADGQDEGQVGEFTNKLYEARLPQYSSKFPATFAVELRGGTIPSLNLQEGQQLKFDAEKLKKRAK